MKAFAKIVFLPDLLMFHEYVILMVNRTPRRVTVRFEFLSIWRSLERYAPHFQETEAENPWVLMFYLK